jgi:hypothetical protein
MKTYFIAFVCTMVFMNSPGQTQNRNFNLPPNEAQIRVKNWAKVSMFWGDEFWADKKQILEEQLGLGAVDSVKKYADLRNLPPQMLFFDGHSKKMELKEYAQKMDSLKCLSAIASFNHISKGQDFGTWYVIQVPYQCNEKWDASATRWGKVYFIFPGEFIELLK